MAELTPVLIIDDDQELCELLRDWLATERFELTAAHDGPSGLAAPVSTSFTSSGSSSRSRATRVTSPSRMACASSV